MHEVFADDISKLANPTDADVDAKYCAHMDASMALLGAEALAPDNVQDEGFQLQVVGLDCTDYSPRGGRKREVGASLPAMLVYLARLRQMMPHAVIVDEAVDFMHKGVIMLSHALGDLFTVEAEWVCPSELGWPTSRRRTWVILRSRQCACNSEWSTAALEGWRR